MHVKSRGTLLGFSALHNVLHPVHVVVTFDNNVMKGEACIERLAAQEDQARSKAI